MYADLHIHSTHSDGALSPEEIVREALAHGVGLIAVTDHELTAGSLETEPIARRAGVGFLRGVEVECREDGRFHHLLAYGVDFFEPGFAKLIAGNRKRLDDMSVELVRRLAPEYPDVSVEDFEAFEHDVTLGGWKGLEYLMRRSVTATLREGMPLYNRYNVTYEGAGFPPLCEVVETIHKAGGRAVLAHPGATVPRPDDERFAATVRMLLSRGLDGVECYYPLHPPEMTRILLEICRARNLMITAGSDCHGAFGRTRVGQMDIPIEALSLKGLYE